MILIIDIALLDLLVQRHITFGDQSRLVHAFNHFISIGRM